MFFNYSFHYINRMIHIRKFYFFRCYHCGAWNYSNKIIKSRKCWKCHRIFQFKNSLKFFRECSMNQAISIMKRLKEREEKETLSKYIINQYDITQFKKF